MHRHSIDELLKTALGDRRVPPQADSTELAKALIREQHGEAGREFLDTALNPSSARADLYAAKNQTLDLSLDSALIWSGDLYRAQLEQIAVLLDEHSPHRIIDIGCEQGLVTCIIATMFPEAEVVGIDPCREAIAGANELRERLRLKNVDFINQDPISGALVAEPADLVLTSRAMIGAAIPTCDDRPAELLAGLVPADPDWQRSAELAAARLSSLLVDGGKLLSLERTGTSGLIRWAKALAAEGLELDRPATTITVDEPGSRGETFRLLEATRGETHGVADGLSASDALGAAPLPQPGEIVDGEAAELAALSSRRLTPLGAWSWRNSWGETEHLELAEDPTAGLVELRCSTNGSRTLAVHASDSANAVLSRIHRELSAVADAEGAEPLLAPPKSSAT